MLRFGPWLKRVAPRTLLRPAKALLAQERAYAIVLKQSSFPAVFSRRKSHRYYYSNSYRFSPGSLHSAFSLRTCQFNGRRGTGLTSTRRKSGAQELRMWFITLLLLQPAKVSSNSRWILYSIYNKWWSFNSLSPWLKWLRYSASMWWESRREGRRRHRRLR